MAPKNLAPGDERVVSPRPSPRSVAQDPRGAGRRTHPATVLRRAGSGAGSPAPGNVLQLQRVIGNRATSRLLPSIQRRGGESGLPAGLAAGIEQLSGISMDGVKVHYDFDIHLVGKADVSTGVADVLESVQTFEMERARRLRLLRGEQVQQPPPPAAKGCTIV